MQITNNFSLEEMCRTDTGLPNPIGPEERLNIIALVTHVLQPLRDLYGQPLRINSGYRSKDVNRAVEGKPDSQHLKGEAADIASSNPSYLLNLLQKNYIVFDQVGIYKTFIHVSFRRLGGNRRQVFIVK